MTPAQWRDLRDRIRAAGVRQDEVAREAGLSQGHVCSILSGRRAGRAASDLVEKTALLLLEEEPGMLERETQHHATVMAARYARGGKFMRMMRGES